MRFSSFLLGGLVGAGAVIYLSRGNRMSVMTSNFADKGNSLGSMMNSVKTRMSESILNRGMQADGQNQNQPKSSCQTGTAYSSDHQKSNPQANTVSGIQTAAGSGLDKVSKLAEKDPYVQSQIEEILSESSHSETSFKDQR